SGTAEREAFAQKPNASATKPTGTPQTGTAAGTEEAGEINFDSGPLKGHVKVGPTAVSLGHDITLNLPAAYIYIDPQGSKKILEKDGYFGDVLGMVVPKAEEPWEILLDYEDTGFIKDDEKIDADDLLKSLREGQEEANKERVKKGFKGLTLHGWSDPPRYDRALHHLVWGLKLGQEGGAATDQSVNYNTRVLGRKGYVSVNLAARESELAKYKGRADEILKATSFNTGAGYGDYKSGDKVAEYGLTGLILGGAGLVGAKVLAKGGLLVLLAKGGKAIALAGVALVAGIGKLLGLKKTGGNAPQGDAPQANPSELAGNASNEGGPSDPNVPPAA
ncbi:MAG: DUF2167 domain-containing protein, partial [Polyangiaceae bacterium]|nr:DUF2167 domain-containing protein [Polyangiaceae bacterium]